LRHILTGFKKTLRDYGQQTTLEKDNEEIAVNIEIHHGRSYWWNVDLFDIPYDSAGKNNSTFVKKV